MFFSSYPYFLFIQFSFLCFSSSAAGGEIFNQCVADNDEAFTEKDVIRLARQILNGVAFLHRNNVVHLDLKVNAQEMLMTNIGRCVLSRVRMGKILFLLCNHSSFSVPRLCSREESLYKSIWPNYHVFFDVSWGNKAAVTETFFSFLMRRASGYTLHNVF